MSKIDGIIISASGTKIPTDEASYEGHHKKKSNIEKIEFMELAKKKKKTMRNTLQLHASWTNILLL